MPCLCPWTRTPHLPACLLKLSPGVGTGRPPGQSWLRAPCCGEDALSSQLAIQGTGADTQQDVEVTGTGGFGGAKTSGSVFRRDS